MQASRLRTAIRLAALPFLAAACIGDPTVVQNELAECATPQVDTTGWQASSEVTFDFRLPPYYTWVPEANRWESGRAWIKPYILTPGAFPDNPPVTLTQYSECTADISTASDVFVQLGRTGFDAPWGSGWYSSATFEDVPVDVEGLEGVVLIESWTPESVEVERQIQVYFTVQFRPVGN